MTKKGVLYYEYSQFRTNQNVDGFQGPEIFHCTLTRQASNKCKERSDHQVDTDFFKRE